WPEAGTLHGISKQKPVGLSFLGNVRACRARLRIEAIVLRAKVDRSILKTLSLGSRARLQWRGGVEFGEIPGRAGNDTEINGAAGRMGGASREIALLEKIRLVRIREELRLHVGFVR